MVIEWQIKIEDPRFVIVTVNNETWREVYKSLFIRRLKKLARSQSIEELETAFAKLEHEVSRNHVLRLLSSRAYTVHEIRSKLQGKRISSSAMEHAISYCKEMGYLNDVSLTESLIAQLRRRGKGGRYIQNTLKKRLGYVPNFPKDETAELETLKSAIEKFCRSRDLKDPKERNRLIRRLLGSGFALEAIFEQLNK